MNEELSSAYVGRNNGYKGPSLRDLITATCPRLLPCDLRYNLGANDQRRYNIYILLEI